VSIWRLEWLRLFRTRRWIGLAAAYVLFGFLGPILTRYQEAIFRHVGGGITVIVPPPSAGQAIGAYVDNASQIGLLVAIVVAAGSLGFDAHPEWAAFLRTRVSGMGSLIVPKFTVNVIAVGAAFTVGMLAAWYETVILIGSVDPPAILAGIACGWIYLSFSVAVVALCAGLARSVVGVVAIALSILIALPILGQVGVSAWWLPSALVGAPVRLVEGASATSFLRAAGVGTVATAAALWAAGRLLARREI
jgi:ABC-2 type transport system permease protein